MKIEDFKLAYELIDVLMQTREWKKISQCDPRIQASNKRLQEAIAKASDSISSELLDEIDAAALALGEASSDAAVLYGIRVAGVLDDVLDNHMAFSKLFLDRTMQRST